METRKSKANNVNSLLEQVFALSDEDRIRFTRELSRFIKDKNTKRNREALRKWNVGDRVHFKGNAGLVEGVITQTKNMKKNVRIRDTFGQNWRVSATLLEAGPLPFRGKK